MGFSVMYARQKAALGLIQKKEACNINHKFPTVGIYINPQMPCFVVSFFRSAAIFHAEATTTAEEKRSRGRKILICAEDWNFPWKFFVRHLYIVSRVIQFPLHASHNDGEKILIEVNLGHTHFALLSFLRSPHTTPSAVEKF